MSMVPAESTSVALPANSEWEMIQRQAQMLASSSMVPRQYRGKPDEIISTGLYGRDLGLSLTASLSLIDNVEGKPTLTAMGMTAVVRSRGHSITGEILADRVIVRGRRADNGDTLTVEWTMDDARVAGLSNKTVWKSYPRDMMWSRAVSFLCRKLFADVVAGLGYTAEELEGMVSAGQETDEQRTVRLKNALKARIDGYKGSDLAKFDKAGAWWTDHGLRAWKDVTLELAEEYAAFLDGLDRPTPPDGSPGGPGSPFPPAVDDDEIVDAELVEHEEPFEGPTENPSAEDPAGARARPDDTPDRFHKVGAAIGLTKEEDRRALILSATAGRTGSAGECNPDELAAAWALLRAWETEHKDQPKADPVFDMADQVAALALRLKTLPPDQLSAYEKERKGLKIPSARQVTGWTPDLMMLAEGLLATVLESAEAS